jgi:putative thioredoxin
MAAYVNNVSESEFQTAVLERSHQVPVVVDFWAEWCGPCKTLGPILERVAHESEGGFELAKVDVDANPRLAGAFGVQGIPTVIAFRDGKPVSRFTGALPEASVRQFISQLLPAPVHPAVLEAEELAEAGDRAGAEQKLAELLAAEPANTEAALALSGLLVERGAYDEALELLARQAPTAEVRSLESVIRLLSSADVDLDDLEGSLPVLLARVQAGGEEREPARRLLLDAFEVLGPDHPRTIEYRRQLASALF